MVDASHRPRAFLDINVGAEPAGRLVIELFADRTPRTCENFLALCNSSKPPLTYKLSPFHRVIDKFMVQGGDITKGDGTGGNSIHGEEFDDESIGWREIDKEGLVCMANRGRNTNTSQFFITLAPCPHLDLKHTVFGQLVSGQAVLERIAKIPVDKTDRPLTDVLIAHCGELKRPKTAADLASTAASTVVSAATTDSSRGRRKRRRSVSSPRSSSSRPSSLAKHKARRSSHTHSTPHKGRRRSELKIDHNLRGRERRRSTSPDAEPPSSAIDEDAMDEDVASSSRSTSRQRKRRRSPSPSRSLRQPHSRSRDAPPSRSRSQSSDKGYRRRRSLPNHYDRRNNRHDDAEKHREKDKGEIDGYGEQSTPGSKDTADRQGASGGPSGPNTYADNNYCNGRLDRNDAFGSAEGGIKLKGRGNMKYRERQR